MVDAERCVMCGEIIPEGRQVCPVCEKNGGPSRAKDGDEKPPEEDERQDSGLIQEE